jgi:hypothetical protein
VSEPLIPLIGVTKAYGTGQARLLALKGAARMDPIEALRHE